MRPWHEEFFSERHIPFEEVMFGMGRDPFAEGKAIADLLEADADDEILDVYCGWGRQAIPLAQLGYQKVLGVDKSAANVEEAKCRAQLADVAIQFMETDIISFPWTTNNASTPRTVLELPLAIMWSRTNRATIVCCS